MSAPPRVLRQGYAVLAVAALGRAGYQLTADARAAPVAYGLSAIAAVFYLAASAALTRSPRSATARLVARRIAATELAGVLIVGAASVLHPAWFPHASVWSFFGAGYLFAPLVLPVLTLRTVRA
ncbi:MAG: hypothetical protein QM679_10150 [Patulibacter sp.]